MINLDRLLRQSCDAVVMVRPRRFYVNPETISSNSFQSKESFVKEEELADLAIAEFNCCVDILASEGVRVFDFDGNSSSPDELYPNNWFSTHEDGRIFVYPMFSENRRLERRFDIFSGLSYAGFEIRSVTDLSYLEKENTYLESTGSMIFDRIYKKIYACNSVRTSKKLLDEFAESLGYEVVFFDAVDDEGKEIFHTNMFMSLGCGFAVFCSESVLDKAERELVLKSLEDSEREIVDLSLQQVYNFAGNVLQVRNQNGESLFIISDRGYKALREDQIAVISKYARIVPLPINFIETCGGGGVRCMMAEVKLPRAHRGL